MTFTYFYTVCFLLPQVPYEYLTPLQAAVGVVQKVGICFMILLLILDLVLKAINENLLTSSFMNQAPKSRSLLLKGIESLLRLGR